MLNSCVLCLQITLSQQEYQMCSCCSLRHGIFSLRHAGNHVLRIEEGNGTLASLDYFTVWEWHADWICLCAFVRRCSYLMRTRLSGCIVSQRGDAMSTAVLVVYCISSGEQPSLPPPACS
jgi:hypothetical protein